MPFLGTIRSVTLSLNHVIVQASVLRLKLHGSGLGQDLRRTRPADILASNWLCGKPAAFDLTVTSPLNAFVILEAGVTFTAGSAVTAAELRKHSANEDKCSLAVESYGAWGTEAQEAFSRLASRLATRRNEGRWCQNSY